MAKSVILQSKVSEGSYRSTILVSLSLHVLLMVAIIVISNLPPFGPAVSLGTGAGGGQGGETIPVSLAGDLGGGAGQYYPSPKPQPPAVELPKPKEPEEKATPLPELTTKPKKELKPKKEGKKPKELEEKRVKKPPKTLPNYIPTETGPGAGGSGRPGGGGGGFGVKMGSGLGGGTNDSWYARSVEQRIGSNWLKSFIGNINGHYEVVISFFVRDNGNITYIRIEKSSGIKSLDDSARRAIEVSNPLAPLPSELRGRPLRLEAYFPYPPK